MPQNVNSNPPADAKMKFLPLSDIDSPRILELRVLRNYYRNTPGFPVLDVEDPDCEKPRVSVGLAKDVVKKRSAFLFGDEKFEGPTAIEFDDDSFAAAIETVWDWNRLYGKILSFGDDFYWAGFAAWKVVVQPTNEKRPIRLNRISPETLYCEFNDGEDHTKFNVKCWIIMYKRDDGTFYREEVHEDRILYYEGALATPNDVSKLKGGATDSDVQMVKFVLKDTGVNDLGVCPIAFAARCDEDSIWGYSVFKDVITRIDRLNEIYTNALFATAKIADPVLWVNGVKDLQQIHKDADAIWVLESPEASLGVLQWVGVPESTISLIKSLTNMVYHECDLPLILRDADQTIGDIPARSLKILYTDLEGATQKDRSIITDWFYDLFEIIWYALSVTNGLGIPDLSAGEGFNFTRINWGTIIPVDKIIDATMVLQEYQAGLLSKRTALAQLGYDEAEIDAIFEETADEKEAATGGNMFGGLVGGDPNSEINQEDGSTQDNRIGSWGDSGTAAP
jgi:hypothetical protein